MNRKKHLAPAPVLWWLIAAVTLMVPTSALLYTDPAIAQGWQWPWETDKPRRAPPPRPDTQRPTPRDYNNTYGNQPAPPQGYGAPSNGSEQRSAICLRLEQQLAMQANHGANAAQRIAELTKKIQDTRGQLRHAEIQLNRRDCYETFLFSRTLKRDRTCIKMARSVDDLQRQLSNLEVAYRQAQSGSERSHQDEIIRELARNNCGAAYTQEARRRSPMRNFWQDEDTGDRVQGNTFAGLPFATYRTLCVRLCDGYYFPVSFSTLPTHFSRDADACQSRCAAPTELYFHQNPGGSIAEMVSQKTQNPYKSLSTAFRYRKEYVPGCSCKQAEYVPQNTTLPNKAGAADPVPSHDQAEKPKRSAMSPVR